MNAQCLHPVQRSFVKVIAIQRFLRIAHAQPAKQASDLSKNSVQLLVKGGRFIAGPYGACTQAVGDFQRIGGQI